MAEAARFGRRVPGPWIVLALIPALGVPSTAGEVKAGVDVLVEHGFRELAGKRVGLITNHTGKTRSGVPTAQVLASTTALRLTALFSPEHGFQGTIEDASVSSDTLTLADGRSLPIYSLYGATQAPTRAMLSGLDALVFDIQDIGSRFYTYSTTMGLAMKSAAQAGIEFYVLDRPNPINGEAVEGPVLSTGIRHFTAYFSVPVRHGMTMGELARLLNISEAVGARLEVVPLSGWTRDQWYDDTGLPWTKPSPNMPDLEAAALYPGVGCFESTNVSVGRGTDAPFRWVGAPWMNADAVLKRLEKAGLRGVRFEASGFTPSKSIYAGLPCRGVRMRVTDRGKLRPLALFAHLACALRDLHPADFGVRWDEIRRMVGTDEFRRLYESGAGPRPVLKLFNAGAREFKARRYPYLLY